MKEQEDDQLASLTALQLLLLHKPLVPVGELLSHYSYQLLQRHAAFIRVTFISRFDAVLICTADVLDRTFSNVDLEEAVQTFDTENMPAASNLAASCPLLRFKTDPAVEGFRREG